MFLRGVLLTVSLAICVGAADAASLGEIKSRGKFRCGLVDGFPGLSAMAADGSWSGFAVDYCRAAAAAILGDPQKVEFRNLDWDQAMPELAAGKVDMIDIGASFTLSRDTEGGFESIGPTIFSGLGFLVARRRATSVYDLKDAPICVVDGAGQGEKVAAYFKARNIALKTTEVPAEDVFKALDDRRCDVALTEPEFAGGARLALKDNAASTVLTERMDTDILGPMVRNRDAHLLQTLRWVHFALLTAEELRIGQGDIDAMAERQDPEVRAFLGNGQQKLAAKLGLDADWTQKVIRAVGNYGEIWERNFGTKSPFRIPRGANALVRDGGLMWSPDWK